MMNAIVAKMAAQVKVIAAQAVAWELVIALELEGSVVGQGAAEACRAEKQA